MKIFILGEAYDEHQEREARPLVGPAGYLLDSLLRDAGIARHECHVANVFNVRPQPTNDISNLCGPKTGTLPPLAHNKYLLPTFYPELARVQQEILDADPNLIIALGGAALWALTGDYRISRARGTIGLTAPAVLKLPPRKYLATYHPWAILREYSLKPVAYLDLKKAKRHSETRNFHRPSRKIYIPESLYDVDRVKDYLTRARRMAVDIETQARQITCIGFAPSANEAFVLPITKGSGSFWSEPQELYVWRAIRDILTTPSQKIFQNGMYDLKFLWEVYGIPVRGAGDDTMLLHHAIYIESEKSLGFMGSVYTDEPSWKTMRSREITTIKKED